MVMIWGITYLQCILLNETKNLDSKIITGLLLITLLLSSSSLFALNIIKPRPNQGRVKLHCILGMLTSLAAFIHVWDKILPSSEKSDLFGLGLMLTVIFTGVVLLYFPQSGTLRHYSRNFHPALVIGIYLFLLLHIFSLYS
jgi:hypothetical protein